MGFMTIDGRKVDLPMKKMSFLLSAMLVLICQHFATIRNYLFSVPVVCVPWKMAPGRTFASCSRNQGTAW